MPAGVNKWGAIAWGAGSSLAGSGSVLDVLNCYSDVAYRLGFTSLAEVVSTSWVTPAELFQWADEAAKKLSYQAGVFVVYDQSITVAIGTTIYNLPTTHVFTLMAAVIDANGIHLMRITPVRDLWALDATYQASSCSSGVPAPTRASMDAGSVGTVTVYPTPITAGTMAQICQEFPAAVTQQASTLALPTILQDYFSYAMLAAARGKESESAMPEMAAHYRERCALYEQIIEHLWGPGQ